MADTPSPRKTQPLCGGCHHPRSFHGSGRCKALGCATCEAYVEPAQAASTPAK